MRPVRPSRSPLVFWLAASLAIHLAILLPAALHVLQQPMGSAAVPARMEQDAVDDPHSEETPLGIDVSDVSTMTWIGHEEYEEHLAQLGEVEQAAFDPRPGTPAAPSPESVIVTEPQPAAPSETEVATTEVAEPPAPQTFPIDPALVLDAIGEMFAILNDIDTTAVETDTREFVAANTEAAEKPDTNEPVTNPQPPNPDPTPPAALDADPTKPADQADRESDASSIVEVLLKDVKIGKPLAARGLELKTARPKFTTLQLVTLAPCCNPLTRIEFTRDGKPLVAQIIETSGHALIDEAVEASLYRWRAAGEPLEALKGEQTMTVEIRILLVNR